jgi:hypothetical protein
VRILVNALSTSNFSGRHVLLGHLRRIARWTVGGNEFVVLHSPAVGDMVSDLGPNVQWKRASPATSSWITRAAWERVFVPREVRRARADVVLTMSGMATAALPVPEVVYAMNPWALVRGLERSGPQRAKAGCGRRARWPSCPIT